MREPGLHLKKSFRPKTTINNPYERKSSRKYKSESTNLGADQVWASDLTYIPTDQGFVYLVVVMDLFNRPIKGWDVSSGMEAENTKNAFVEAIKGLHGKLSRPGYSFGSGDTVLLQNGSSKTGISRSYSIHVEPGKLL